MIHLDLAAGAALMLLLADPSSAAAQAQEAPDGLQSYAVRMHVDQRPRTPEAARGLLDRLGDAALEACGASPFSLPGYKASVAASPCWRDAMDAAIAQLDDPLLSAAFDARRGRPGGEEGSRP